MYLDRWLTPVNEYKTGRMKREPKKDGFLKQQ